MIPRTFQNFSVCLSSFSMQGSAIRYEDSSLHKAVTLEKSVHIVVHLIIINVQGFQLT